MSSSSVSVPQLSSFLSIFPEFSSETGYLSQLYLWSSRGAAVPGSGISGGLAGQTRSATEGESVVGAGTPAEEKQPTTSKPSCVILRRNGAA
jgi:hypothetical protein